MNVAAPAFYKIIPMGAYDSEGTPRLLSRVNSSGNIKLASEVRMQPDMEEFWAYYKAEPAMYSYYLINIVGSFERYGANRNGDAFAISALERYHKTFMQGHPFTLHDNDDTNKALGRIIYASWNPIMSRVEVLSRLLRSDARVMKIDADWEAGHPPDVSMGCFLAGALVTMADGTRKPIELVAVGDEILTHTGKASKVTTIHRRPYKGEAIGIKPAVGSTFWTTPEHPFWATSFSSMKGSGGSRWMDNPPLAPEWIHSGCLDDHALLAPILTDTLTPDYVNRAFARLFGYYLAEGHVLRNKAKEIVGIELTTNKSDPVHCEIESLCAEFGTKNTPAYHKIPHSESAVGIYIFDPKLAQLCYQHGGGYARQKRMSAEAMRWDPEMQREILGAYANGDGCATELGALTLSTAATDLAWQWITLLPRLGILASIQNLEHKAGSGFSANATYEWVIHIGKQWAQDLQDVCSKILPVGILAHRNDRLIVGDYVVTPIREKLTLFVDTEVFNLEIEDDDSSYLIYGLGVHNCKVPFDRCSICNHRSRTRAEYCEHLLYHMNQLWPSPQDSDGRRSFAWNDDPCYFDQSFVHVRADQQSGIMSKVAAYREAKSGVFIPSYMDPEVYVKESSEVVASIKKTGPGDMTATPETASPAPLPQAAAVLAEHGRRMAEEDSPVPMEDLEGAEPDQLVTTMTMMGMKVHPVEYTYVVVKKRLSPDMAREMYDSGKSLVGPCPGDLASGAMAVDNFLANLSPKLACAMKRHLKGRSMYRNRSLSMSKRGQVEDAPECRFPAILKIAEGLRDEITRGYWEKTSAAVRSLHLMSEEYEKNAQLVVEVQENPLEPFTGLEPVVAAQARLMGAYGLKV